MSAQRLIFIHIPKTAGSSMKDVLVRQYGARLRDVHDEDARIQRQNVGTPSQPPISAESVAPRVVCIEK